MNFKQLKPFIIVAIVSLLVLAVIQIVKQRQIINSLKHHNDNLAVQLQKQTQHSYEEPEMNDEEAQKMFSQIMENLNLGDMVEETEPQQPQQLETVVEEVAEPEPEPEQEQEVVNSGSDSDSEEET